MTIFETAATVTVRDAAQYTDAGRRVIANWLREQADELERHGTAYAPVHTARFRCPVHSEQETAA